MKAPKVILFDADGVLTLPEEVFSIVYSKSHGLDPEPFAHFFRTEWMDFVTGKRDLKQHIRDNPDLWQWSGSPDELMQYWCETEDVRNEELIGYIKELRGRGYICGLATEQEQYRGEYMQNVMFKGLFDHYFITADIGYKKSNPEFFKTVISRLKEEHGEIGASDIIFFDDSQSKVDAALSAGLNARLYTGALDFKRDVKAILDLDL